MEDSEIKRFYKGSKVFVTGSTGFVGKSIIEKLLRVTEVDVIYVLIREKKGKTITERLKRMFENPLFQVLRKQSPNFETKIKPIAGECGEAGLGISDANREEIVENINIIFHIAATVNFNENLKRAYDVNVGGTQELIAIAKEITNLKSFVFVSTAFSNCLRKHVEEKVYDYSFDTVSKKMENFTEQKNAESLQNNILGKWPNTYTFTKALAETLVENNKNDLPIGIFRPSVIISSYKEPIPAWTDNIYAVNGITIGVLTGFLRVFFSDGNNIMEAVPIDMVVSALLACSWEIAEYSQKKITTNDILVYNYTSGPENPIEYQTMFHINYQKISPTMKSIWKPCGLYVKNELLGLVLTFFLQFVPGFFMDLVLVLCLQKPRFVSMYMKAFRFMWVLRFFGQTAITYNNDNVQKLWDKINETDKKLFEFSLTKLNWLTYSDNYTLGMRRYILKEDDSNLDQAKRKFYWFQVLHCVFLIVGSYILVSIILIMLRKLYCLIL